MILAKKAFKLAKSHFGDLVVGIAFGKLSRLLPLQRVSETNKVIAFWHPKPFWEKHIVIVPKKAIKRITALKRDDEPYISAVFVLASEIVQELGWDKDCYSITVNGGNRQEVNQIHFHLHSGKILSS